MFGNNISSFKLTPSGDLIGFNLKKAVPIVLNENEKIYLNDAIKPFGYENNDYELSQYYYELAMKQVNANYKGFSIRIDESM